MIQAMLTIDDIPSKNTRSITDYLTENGIRAILFAVGEKAEQDPDSCAYAIQHGMIVGNHSYSHPHFSDLSVEEGIREIEKCEAVLDRVYEMAGTKRVFRPFRFPYGDKGGKNKEALQTYLRENRFSKVKDTQIPYAWWHENGLDQDIDTLWTFDFAEYNIRPGSGFTLTDVWNRIRDMDPRSGGALLAPEGRHILLLHAHDETDELVPGYYRLFLDELQKKKVEFVKPAFL